MHKSRAVEIKLSEVPKSLNVDNYSITWGLKKDPVSEIILRSSNTQTLMESGKSKLVTSTFICGAAKLWSKCPGTIKNCNSTVVLALPRLGNQDSK